MRRSWCAFLLASCWSASAGVNVWTGHGPDAGSVFRVAVSPSNGSTVYACGGAGYRVSTDGGPRWPTLADAGIIELARACFELTVSTTWIYRCSLAWGCYRSSDGGASWSAFST